MAGVPFSPAAWDALRRLAYLDGDRAAVLGSLTQARARTASDAGLEAARARLREAQAAHGRMATERRNKERDIEDLNLRVSRTEGRLASGQLQHEREIAAAQTEIGRLRAAIAADEAAWLEASTQEDALTAEVAELQAALEVEERAAAPRVAAAQREAADLEARLTAIDQGRREAAQAIPAEVRERYRTLFGRTGGRPFAVVDAGECSNCRRTLPAAAVQLVRSRSGVPNCPSCGRLLLDG